MCKLIATTLTIGAIILGTGHEKAYAESNKDPCFRAAGLASTIMRVRQNGAPLHKVLKLLYETVPEGERTTAEDMVLDAYRVHDYQTKAMEAKAVTTFSDKWLMRCLGE